MTERACRPGPLRWLWYAYGGGLPFELSPWVLSDTTRPTWVWRHLARSVVQLLPLLVLFLLVPPVPLEFRLTAAAGGLLMGLLFSAAYMTETTEHRAVKAGYAPGTTALVREERAEQRRFDRALAAELRRLERAAQFRSGVELSDQVGRGAARQRSDRG
ncbi:hypothetical protein GB931_09785 [Modestobacter sp. I12A-02628]|uniref:DUF5313 family protein n=1 Tax=Goekera deserti TaxID=2497753 RepID=UPI00141D1F49|nr:DUF5313 family protein [Goekera deserti]MPQ98204.1 hypothetical protein [Goekera deserti]